MEAVKTNDPAKLDRVVEYSFADSLRMQQLWEETSVDFNLETVCNRLGITIPNLLHNRPSTIIDQVMYNIDAGAYLQSGIESRPNFLKAATPGIYHDVFIYDYSKLYRLLMKKSSNHSIKVFARRLKGSPPNVILKAFYSKYVDRSELQTLLDQEINRLKSTNMIISIEGTIVKAVGPIEISWTTLVDTFPCYISITTSSYIALEDNGNVVFTGLAKICRPPCPLITDFIHQFITLIDIDSIEELAYPEINQMDQNKFVMTQKIEHIQSYEPGSFKYELARQQGGDISTWANVPYVMMTRGPVLVSNITSDDHIDYNYYHHLLNTTADILYGFKNYRAISL